MSAKPHILTVPNPILPGEWKKVRTACGEEVHDAEPVISLVTEFQGLGVYEVFNALRSCGKCLKKLKQSGWKRYSYGVVSGMERREELRREMEA